MGTEVTFIVPGLPRGKQRARYSSRTNHFFPAEQTVSYEAEVKWAAKRAGCTPREGPVQMVIKAFFPIPRSRPKGWRIEAQAEQEWYIQKPDFDNTGKIVSDALNQVAYVDDKQVVSGLVEKRYSPTPRLEVTLRYL